MAFVICHNTSFSFLVFIHNMKWHIVFWIHNFLSIFPLKSGVFCHIHLRALKNMLAAVCHLLRNKWLILTYKIKELFSLVTKTIILLFKKNEMKPAVHEAADGLDLNLTFLQLQTWINSSGRCYCDHITTRNVIIGHHIFRVQKPHKKH